MPDNKSNTKVTSVRFSGDDVDKFQDLIDLRREEAGTTKIPGAWILQEAVRVYHSHRLTDIESMKENRGIIEERA